LDPVVVPPDGDVVGVPEQLAKDSAQTAAAATDRTRIGNDRMISPFDREGANTSIYFGSVLIK